MICLCRLEEALEPGGKVAAVLQRRICGLTSPSSG